MLVKRCDRCGKIYDAKGYRLIILNGRDPFYLMNNDLNKPLLDVDLCKGCEELLNEWYMDSVEYKE